MKNIVHAKNIIVAFCIALFLTIISREFAWFIYKLLCGGK
nr:MAG TPA: hypothetical protein [Caudoviricetes sp.]